MRTDVKIVIIFAASALIFTAVCAQTPADDGVANANTERVVCVREPDMGSRLGRRVCSTKAERQAAAEIRREGVNTATGGFQPAGAGN
jgi:hypothetical protein